MLFFSWLLKARKKRRAVTEEGESKNGVDPGVERLIRAFSHTESRLPIRSPTACSSAPLQEVRHQSTSELHEKSPLRGQSHSAHPLVLRFYFEHELPTDHSRIFFTECSFTYITWSLFLHEVQSAKSVRSGLIIAAETRNCIKFLSPAPCACFRSLKKRTANLDIHTYIHTWIFTELLLW